MSSKNKVAHLPMECPRFPKQGSMPLPKMKPITFFGKKGKITDSAEKKDMPL
jgi:hypothetical protein